MTNPNNSRGQWYLRAEEYGDGTVLCDGHWWTLVEDRELDVLGRPLKAKRYMRLDINRHGACEHHLLVASDGSARLD